MFERVLIASDFSPGALELFHCLGELKTVGTRELILVWAVDIRVGMGFSATLQKNHLQKLEQKKHELEKEGFEVKTAAPIGIPAAEIVNIARDHEVSLILISSRGKNTLRGYFLGSTVSDVIRMTETPTLIERIEVTQEKERFEVVCKRKLRSLLLATDFSSGVEKAERITMQLSCEAEKVVVVSVLERPEAAVELTPTSDRIKEQLEGLRQECLHQCPEVRVRLEEGDAAKIIARAAGEEDSSLIIMGTRGKGQTGTFRLGRTAEAVARTAGCPVLLVPNKPV